MSAAFKCDACERYYDKIAELERSIIVTVAGRTIDIELNFGFVYPKTGDGNHLCNTCITAAIGKIANA